VGGGGVLVGALLVGTLFLTALAAKERDNRFCVACHLHDAKFSRLVTAPATDLAGFHYQRKADVGCIACHGGAGKARHLQVWLVAGVDTLGFLAGLAAEPTKLWLPLRDADCRPCHTPIEGARARGSVEPTGEATFAAEAQTEGRAIAYHAIREHGTVPIACVRCHPSHTTGSDAGSHFIAKVTIRPLCRECHRDF
jgi:hypothetical protein